LSFVHVCAAGAGQCEYPWEFPAYGRFGCAADCGKDNNTTRVAVNVRADFTGHPTIAPHVLMASAKWNLCLSDPERTARGEADLCWRVARRLAAPRECTACGRWPRPAATQSLSTTRPG
jgi:hypothetical protein